MTHDDDSQKARRRVRTRPSGDLAHRCRKCGGPCRTWAGSTWEYTCRSCIRLSLFGTDDPTPDKREVLPLLSDQRSDNSVDNGVRL